jgi:exodeoxyribonuclease VII small subunit
MAEKINNGEMNFETAMTRLEQIVNLLEGGRVTLDESLKLYEEGVSLVRLCSDSLDKAEQSIKTVRLDGNGNGTEEDFEA